MVDDKTYKLMHGDDDDEEVEDCEELDEDSMRADDPPTEPFLLLLPATIRGYGFHNKKWSKFLHETCWQSTNQYEGRLLVKHIRDIQWNKAAFNHRLVLKEEKKELIRALISVHIGQKNALKTDFMDGKGDGLIILLHGGPGTGKTLTAESVAEFAERPLYRVTCGDIGTDPESVEKYLESVLFIGSTWGCVILLDEADVFLEERTKQDMQRNALVSVFLRVLEYYDGILILTTNRIGTFDEAFKSRVQLALHYPPLNDKAREEIWHNFMRSLFAEGENVDFEELNEKIYVLARHKLNGRQIRNTISTARQLAQYRKEKLRFVHMNQALQVVDEFEKYVTDVHGHSDEEYARDLGTR
jgi:SpoVK/Ycf46/Vps4 family AAA+-type ATPase